MENNNNEFERSLGRLEGKMDSMTEVMTRLANSFDNLEKGRLSTLEINFAKFYTEINTKAKNAAFWTSAITAIFVSVVSAIIVYLLKI